LDSSVSREIGIQPKESLKETSMAAVPISRTAGSTGLQPLLAPVKQDDWSHLVAAGTVLAGGALLAAGHKRAGLAVAVAGTAIALLDEREAAKEWWTRLPGYLDDAQHFLDKVEGYLKEATVQGQRLQGMLRR
jgi:hypothetical protein